jgi:hypothetical protein
LKRKEQFKLKIPFGRREREFTSDVIGSSEQTTQKFIVYHEIFKVPQPLYDSISSE